LKHAGMTRRALVNWEIQVLSKCSAISPAMLSWSSRLT
jgi:hypothetical protein